MGSRIITLQRQARELGRLRSGYTDTSGKRPRPVRSATWIVTSHSAEYCEAAVGMWGGTVEKWNPQGAGAEQYRVITEAAAVDAILPPGDPLSQYYESWSRGGCARRCDGETELLSDSPCLCRAQWGEDFHATVSVRDGACQMTTRLGVILPDLPDVGVWRMETHSYYAANEISAAVDLLKGQLGTSAMIPVRLRIEPRTRVAGGKTKQFPVTVVELRGATAGQVLSGASSAVEGEHPSAVEAAPAPEIEAPARDWRGEVEAATTADRVRELYRACVADGAMTQELSEYMKGRASALDQATEEPPAVAPAPVDDGQDVDELWMRCVSAWSGSTTELVDAYAANHGGELPDNATGEELAAFLADVKAGKVTAPGEGSAEEVPF
ncbi:recombination directionality factor [Nocardiopsis oceani]